MARDLESAPDCNQGHNYIGPDCNQGRFEVTGHDLAILPDGRNAARRQHVQPRRQRPRLQSYGQYSYGLYIVAYKVVAYILMAYTVNGL